MAHVVGYHGIGSPGLCKVKNMIISGIGGKRSSVYAQFNLDRHADEGGDKLFCPLEGKS
ncbi:MAG TPA: hypothetical protein VIJ79_18550 [Acidobacteriaceae bacterium]